MITFTCEGKGCSPRQWEGSLEIPKKGNPCEAELYARGIQFHLLVGRHSYGNYLCIPDWDIGTELSSLADTFWNEERLRQYCRMKKADACTTDPVIMKQSGYEETARTNRGITIIQPNGKEGDRADHWIEHCR